jgi:hypothetical protein
MQLKEQLTLHETSGMSVFHRGTHKTPFPGSVCSASQNLTQQQGTDLNNIHEHAFKNLKLKVTIYSQT